MALPAGIMAGANMAGGIVSAFGASKNLDWQKEAFRRSMRYNTLMSNTQWQRGVADMRAAGLNPALAYEQGGASSPNAPSSPDLPNPLEDVGRGVANSAQAAINTKLDLQRKVQENKKLYADGQLTMAQNAQLTKESTYRLLNLIASFNEASAGAFSKSAAGRVSQQEFEMKNEARAELVDALRFQISTMKSQARQANSAAHLQELDVPRAGAEAQYYRGIGKFAPYVGGAKSLLDLIPGPTKFRSAFDRVGGVSSGAPSVTEQMFPHPRY